MRRTRAARRLKDQIEAARLTAEVPIVKSIPLRDYEETYPHTIPRYIKLCGEKDKVIEWGEDVFGPGFEQRKKRS